MGWTIPATSAYGGILMTRCGRILLREPSNHFDGYVWTFAKGRKEPGDTPEETALREVLEETDYKAEIVDLIPNVFHGGTTTTVFFVMRHLGQQARPSWETTGLHWANFSEAADLIKLSTNLKGQARDLLILGAAKAWYDATAEIDLPCHVDTDF